jgi:hypothetical protein
MKPDLAPSRPASRTLSTHLILRIDRTLYAVHTLACDPLVAIKAFRLNKLDGTLYDIAQTEYGPQCDCPDFIFRRDGIDPAGCKHVKALVAEGLIEG